jgi:hypothetical protein
MDQGDERIRAAARMEPMIGEDTPCRGCGYNLKGLEASGKCPECGRPIRRRRKLKHGECTMTAAPKSWLRVYSLGMTIAFVAWPAMIGGVFLRCVSGSRETALFAFAAGCAWWLGVVIATRPRPDMPDMVTTPAREWFWRRVLARILSAAVAIPLGVLFLTSGGAGAPPISISERGLWLIADLGLLLAAVGFGAFAFYMFELAHWAGDYQASTKWRAAAAGVLMSALLVILGRNINIAGGITTGLIALPGLVILFLLLMASVVVPEGYAFWALLQQRNSAAWAIANHDDAAAKVLRDREKLARERAEALAAGPPDIVPHVELPNVADSKKMRYNPKTMVPGPAPKRVKFTDPEFGGSADAETSYGLDPEGTPAPEPEQGKAARGRQSPGLLYNPKTMTPGPAPKRVTNFDAALNPSDPPRDPGDEQAFDLSPEPEKPA